MQQYAVRPIANELVLCGTKEKGVHGCLVASLKADVLGEESAGPPEMGAQPEGPAPGRRPWDSGGSFPRGETTTAQCTGQYRLEPVPGRKPGIVRALYCLACLFVLNRCTPLITYFGAGGRCWWPGRLFPTPLSPFPPVDRCGHTRVPPKIPRLLVGQFSTGSEVQMRISHAQASRRVLTGAPKRFDM